MRFVYSDGGRRDAGYQGNAGDCVIRAIAIGTGQGYKKTYADLFEMNKKQRGILKGASPCDDGTQMATIKKYLASLGWIWNPTMGIGTGCKVHLVEGELPKGYIIVRLSKHLTAIINGIIYDTSDPSRHGTRCVYGYWVML